MARPRRPELLLGTRLARASVTMQESDVLPLPAAMAAPPTAVAFKTSSGGETLGTLLRLTPHSAAFELHTPDPVLRSSEVLPELKISADRRQLYCGRAVVTGLVNTGAGQVCEVSLAESLRDVDLSADTRDLPRALRAGFSSFLTRWQSYYRVQPDFKVAVADLQSFMAELRGWLDQIEMSLAGLNPAARKNTEEQILAHVPAASALTALFERFDAAARRIPLDFAPAHRQFCHQHLHSHLLLSPFNHRIFAKPLGYAGDYEMIDMIIRNRPEGGSLFAKLIHSFILDQAPARSVRNRAKYFLQRFIEETARVTRDGKIARLYSLGCGPAWEVQQFLAEQALSDQAEFCLLDFNDETLAYATHKTTEMRTRYHRRTPIRAVKKSVYNLLKGPADSDQPATEEGFDLIYCSGLYDYLNDRVCKALNTFLYDQLLPGGVLVVTNFDPVNPIRNLMEYVFEWFLIHRNARQMLALAPEQAPPEACSVSSDPTGCNVFLELRKPQ